MGPGILQLHADHYLLSRILIVLRIQLAIMLLRAPTQRCS